MLGPDRRLRLAVAMVMWVIIAAANAAAQTPRRRPAAAPPAVTSPVPEPTLVFEREVFDYGLLGKRDPFAPLTAQQGSQPRFEMLTLRGIIHSPDGESVALLAEQSGRIHRIRPGDALGNVRVQRITPDRVYVTVSTFGVIRQEQWVLRSPGGAASAGSPPVNAPETVEPAVGDDDIATPLSEGVGR
jgi:hypothetical protein